MGVLLVGEYLFIYFCAMPRVRDERKIKVIYQAALKLVLAEGFSGLKMSAVAKEAEVATGTVYIYFKNKHELINQLYLHLKRKKTNYITSGYDPQAPFLQGFRVMWYNFFNASLLSAEESAFLEQYYRSPYIREDTKVKRNQMLDPVYQLLERGKAEGYVKLVETEILLAQLIGPIHELVRLHHEAVLEADEPLQEQAFQLAWDSVKA